MRVAVRPITAADLPRVGEYLQRALNERVSARTWADATVTRWSAAPPNHGFLLEDDGRVVGALLAFYSERVVGGRPVRVCNLGAWCVDEDRRLHSIRLLKAALAQEGWTFTDFSPSGNVVPVNERLGFSHLDTSTVLVPCLPYPTVPGRLRVLRGSALAARLDAADRQRYLDHADAPAAWHVVLESGDRYCYVIFRRDRRKNMPVFASLLYVSDPVLFRSAARVFVRHLLVRHGVLVLLAELRITGGRPRPSIRQATPRRKMVRTADGEAPATDYLYSELARVPW